MPFPLIRGLLATRAVRRGGSGTYIKTPSERKRLTFALVPIIHYKNRKVNTP